MQNRHRRSACRFFYAAGEPNSDTTFFGRSIGVGFGSPGADFHLGFSNTDTYNKFNIYEAADDLYQKIMEW